MKSICNININGTHVHGRLYTVYLSDESFYLRSETDNLIFGGGGDIFMKNTNVYTHK